MADNDGTSKVRQQLSVIEVDDGNIELRVRSDDEAGALLWAAQWLDEHREYSMTAIRMIDTGTYGEDEEDTTITIVVKLHLFHEPTPGKLGPWPHGVPPIPL
jgi:hypothetical protein